jgi:hypothetical protein
MALAIQNGVVRIVSVDGVSSGMGFVADRNGLVITCSRVIQNLHSQRRNDPRPQKVTIYFNNNTANLEAEVLEIYWRPEYLEDVGVVKIIGDLPEHVETLPSGYYQVFPGASFELYGCMSSGSGSIVLGTGEIHSETRKNGIRHLLGSVKNLDADFTGTPVWSTIQNCVIGIVTSMITNKDHSDFLIVPTELLNNIIPELPVSQGLNMSIPAVLKLVMNSGNEGDGGQYLHLLPSFSDMKDQKVDPASWVTWLKLKDRYAVNGEMMALIDDLINWLPNSMDDGQIRRALYPIIASKGSEAQAGRMVLDSIDWLSQHPSDVIVRTSFLNFVENNGSARQFQQQLTSTIFWLKENADDHTVRCALLDYLSRSGETAQVDELIWATTRWLQNHDENIDVRQSLVRLVKQKGIAQQSSEFILEMNEWMSVHPEYTQNFGMYLSLVEEKGTLEQITEAIWIVQKHLGEKDVFIAQYIGLVNRKGTPEQAAKVMASIGEWLIKHPEDTVVRPPYLSFVEKRGTPEQLAQAIQFTEVWLQEHPDDHVVRVSYLLLVERKESAEKINEMIVSTMEWLKSHPDGALVISAFIGIMKRKGQPEHVSRFILQMDEWVNSHPDNHHIGRLYSTFKKQILPKPSQETQTTAVGIENATTSVALPKKKKKGKAENIDSWIDTSKEWLSEQSFERSQTIALIAKSGTSEQVARLVMEVQKQLDENLADEDLGILFLKLVEKRSQPKELQESFSWMKGWLDRHSESHSVRKRLLGLVARRGNDDQVDDILSWFADWLQLHPQELIIRKLYLELAARKGTRPRMEEAVEIHKAWVTVTELSMSESALLHFYGKCLQILQRFGEAEKIYRRATKLFYGAIPSRIELAWCLYAQGRKKAAETELLAALKTVSRGTLKNYIGRVSYNVGSYYLKEGDPDTALEYFNESIQRDPENFLGYFGGGQALVRLKKNPDAISAFDTALAKLTEKDGEEVKREIETFLRLARSAT